MLTFCPFEASHVIVPAGHFCWRQKHLLWHIVKGSWGWEGENPYIRCVNNLYFIHPISPPNPFCLFPVSFIQVYTTFGNKTKELSLVLKKSFNIKQKFIFILFRHPTWRASAWAKTQALPSQLEVSHLWFCFWILASWVICHLTVNILVFLFPVWYQQEWCF